MLDAACFSVLTIRSLDFKGTRVGPQQPDDAPATRSRIHHEPDKSIISDTPQQLMGLSVRVTAFRRLRSIEIQTGNTSLQTSILLVMTKY